MASRSLLTTHVLDTSIGQPASGVAVTVARVKLSGELDLLAAAETNDDGRAPDLILAEDKFSEGIYKIRFATGEYFSARSVQCFHPHVEITFTVTDAKQHLHVPLLLSPFGYTTYRGS